MKQLVLGWGNPIAGDDGLGWKAADRVAARLGPSDAVDVMTSAHGALRVAERMLGYERVIVLDAAVGAPCLKRHELFPRAMEPSDRALRHDGALAEAIAAIARLGAEGIPERVILLTAAIEPPRAWSDRPSPAADGAARRLADAAMAELEGVPVG